MIGIETDTIINKPLNSLLISYQKFLENEIAGSDFAPDYLDTLTHLCHKISLNCEWVIYGFSWLNKKQKSNNNANK